jgi:tRNA A-37 threonylcarbamoyl transferase component Bud32
MTAASEDAVPWKTCLMDEQYDCGVAEQVGRLLSRLHRQSRILEDAEKKSYMDLSFFRELRIDPFYLFVAAKVPSHASIIHRLADQLTQDGMCLVHGDYTPKNMLVNHKGEFVLLDFEVIHWGNPVFDVALCLCHLILKGWYSGHYEAFRKLIAAFQDGYGSLDEEPIIAHIGLLLLARLDGKSPVEYIQHDGLKNQIRQMALYGLDHFSSGERLELADYLDKFWR